MRLAAKAGATAANPGPQPEEVVLRREEDRLVLQAIADLGETDAELVKLHMWEELSRHELASIFDISVQALDMRLVRARNRIARRLKSLGYVPDISTHPRAAEEGGAT
jgi:RNA polymerase sigma-70 factor (ECF subfamily)